MKRGATKEEIILATYDFIIRNGIRAIRVDEIAQMQGISKRTLYEMFADRAGLIDACIEYMSRLQHHRIERCCNQKECNPLVHLFRLVEVYIDGLCIVECNVLSEIMDSYSHHWTRLRQIWHDEFMRVLAACRQQQLFLSDIDLNHFAIKMLDVLIEARRRGNHTREDLQLLCRTVIRGTATLQGIRQIDNLSSKSVC